MHSPSKLLRQRIQKDEIQGHDVNVTTNANERYANYQASLKISVLIVVSADGVVHRYSLLGTENREVYFEILDSFFLTMDLICFFWYSSLDYYACYA